MAREGVLSGFLIFLLGALAGVFLALAIAVWGAFHLADWLVVSERPLRADVAVVLAGGRGSRLQKGLDLFQQGLARALVLVGKGERDWDAMLARICPDCGNGGKPVTILTGSTSTLTDARLTHAHCVEKGIERILVVTDSYYTRRASIFFNREFSGSGIEVKTVSSGDYRDRLPPTESWWLDESTLQIVLMEAAKIAAFHLALLPDPLGNSRP